LAILPTAGKPEGGSIRGAASALAGNVGADIKGFASKQASGLNPRNIASQVGRTIDLNTGGLLSAARGAITGPVSADDISEGVVQSNPNQPLNISGLPQWGGLSEYLFAQIVPCDARGNIKKDGEQVMKPILAPATDVQFDSTLNWQSPFEQTGPENKAPTIMALLQTGQIATVANALQTALPDGAVGDFAKDLAGKAERWARSLEGRTGITKLNSRQVFSGMPPVRVTMTLHFRAVTNADIEVVEPYEKLLQWAWPQKLAENGIISEVITSDDSLIYAMFPSEAPSMISFKFGNNRFPPMVIESVSNPLDGPMDSSGRPLYRAVQIVVATLTALDKNDATTIFRRSP
jgi:hypothetical protein